MNSIMEKYSKKLSIIIVSFRSANHLERCVSSIYEKIGDSFPWEIILVNNDADQDVKTFQIDFSRIRVLDHKKNIGFGSGMNLGAKLAKGEFLFFLNPDTEILTENITSALLELSDGDAGIVGGGIVDKKNQNQKWSAGKELSVYDLIRNNLGLSRSRHAWLDPGKIECDWVAGTAMLVKKELFEELGGFDERFFMYFEDMDLCRRTRHSGKKVIFFPDFKVFHGNGKSYTDKKLQKKHYFDSMEKYFQKNHRLSSLLTLRVLKLFFVWK